MSARLPVIGAYYQHDGLPVLQVVEVTRVYIVLVNPAPDGIDSSYIVPWLHWAVGCWEPVNPPTRGTADDVMALADAVGVTPNLHDRLAGEQPAVEFTTGPTSHGALWTDQRLAEVLASWGGAS